MSDARRAAGPDAGKGPVTEKGPDAEKSPAAATAARPQAPVRGLARRARLRWRSLPLAATFACYLVAYLALATALSLVVTGAARTDDPYALTVTVSDGTVTALDLYGGPYLLDPATGELVPASELAIPGDEPLAVFVGLAGTEGPRADSGRRIAYATVEDVRRGRVRLFDWGLNYSGAATHDEVLASAEIPAEDLAAYDAAQRRLRADPLGLLDKGVAAALSEGSTTSNVAYYAQAVGPSDPASRLRSGVARLAPWAIYAGLAWAMFRRFYRAHLEEPLGALEGAAARIGAQDLDFTVPAARGRELSRLSEAMELMRSSLLRAHRELWRTAEERRRLNAAFAHDLRTPLTVLKGTLEMARLRAGRARGADGGRGPDAAALDDATLSSLEEQVARLEAYAAAMGGLSRLEDRACARAPHAPTELAAALRGRAQALVGAQAPRLALGFEDGLSEGARDGEVLLADEALLGEVLDNLLANACAHASSRARVAVASPRAGELELAVSDDGPGFTAEALRRGTEPFFGESRGDGHMGLGLSIARTLCELHGGSLELANEGSGGARATARLDVTEGGSDGREER